MSKWKNSRDVIFHMHATKVIEERCKSAWSSIKKKLEEETDSEADQSTDNDHQLTNKSSTDENYQLKNQIRLVRRN